MNKKEYSSLDEQEIYKIFKDAYDENELRWWNTAFVNIAVRFMSDKGITLNGDKILKIINNKSSDNMNRNHRSRLKKRLLKANEISEVFHFKKPLSLTSNEWNKKLRAESLEYKLASNYRSYISIAVRKCGVRKNAHLEQMLGCSVVEFKKYLESKFEEGMSWDNYGDWHIDHIKPCASYDLKDEEQQKLCFNYKNLQPLWAKDNMSKSSIHNGKKYFYKKGLRGV